MPMHDRMTARPIVRRGSRASSASGAAASKPMKARIAYTDPAITPEMPSKPSTVAYVVPKTASVLSSALATSQTARSANTAISNTPSTVPTLALILIRSSRAGTR
jgi:hypothetical protein